MEVKIFFTFDIWRWDTVTKLKWWTFYEKVWLISIIFNWNFLLAPFIQSTLSFEALVTACWGLWLCCCWGLWLCCCRGLWLLCCRRLWFDTLWLNGMQYSWQSTHSRSIQIRTFDGDDFFTTVFFVPGLFGFLVIFPPPTFFGEAFVFIGFRVFLTGAKIKISLITILFILNWSSETFSLLVGFNIITIKW